MGTIKNWCSQKYFKGFQMTLNVLLGFCKCLKDFFFLTRRSLFLSIWLVHVTVNTLLWTSINTNTNTHENDALNRSVFLLGFPSPPIYLHIWIDGTRLWKLRGGFETPSSRSRITKDFFTSNKLLLSNFYRIC
jgi:hypothetical protein